MPERPPDAPGPRRPPATAARHLLAIAVLPFTVTVLVPYWIAQGRRVSPALGGSAGSLAIQAAGLARRGRGRARDVSAVRRGASAGRGTLAPWDPPPVFVVHGPYRFVRNPMISGVILALFGEALVLLSPAHGAWTALFLALNLLYIPLVEEPQLERRFGEAYREYCRHVPRFLPSPRPWPPAP